MTHTKGTPGRPRLPPGEKKVVLSVAVAPEVIAWLGTLQAKKSAVVQKLIDDAMKKAGFAMPVKPKPIETRWEMCPARLEQYLATRRPKRQPEDKVCYECGGEAHAKGLCQKHYNQQYNRLKKAAARRALTVRTP
jgi:hypothetical protein